MLSPRLSAVVLLVIAVTTATRTTAQAPTAELSYVVRGKQSEVRQRALKERVERFHAALVAVLQQRAPDLLARLDPPPPGIFGYQILPRIMPDRSVQTLPAPQVLSYSWGWSDTLLAQSTATLEQLETDLANARPLPSAESRVVCESVLTRYQSLIASRRRIDADFDYNWLWQRTITIDRPGFDKATRLLETVRERQALEAARSAPDEATLRRAVANITSINGAETVDAIRAAIAARARSLDQEIADGMGAVRPPDFVRVEPTPGRQWVVTVPLFTDITDTAFVQAFKDAVETEWHVRGERDEYRVQLTIETLSPERMYCGHIDGRADQLNQFAVGCTPPAVGATLDFPAHVARFPPGGAVLTTSSMSTHVTAGRVIVLAPHDVTPRVLAHELGHMLGIPDGYVRGYQDLGADGFKVMELVTDSADIMASPGTGRVLARHFESLIRAKGVQPLMMAALDAFYGQHNLAEAAARFREVLERSPGHYGAMFQLAKVLDEAGETAESVALWRKVLEVAEAVHDPTTAGTARARLGRQP